MNLELTQREADILADALRYFLDTEVDDDDPNPITDEEIEELLGRLEGLL